MFCGLSAHADHPHVTNIRVTTWYNSLYNSSWVINNSDMTNQVELIINEMRIHRKASRDGIALYRISAMRRNPNWILI